MTMNKFLCVFSAVVLAVGVVPAADAYAETETTVEISAASMLAYLGDTITGQYLKTDFTYGQCDYSYVGTYTINNGEGFSGSLLGRTVLMYQSPLYSNLTDLNTTWALARGGIFDAYANFGDVTYFDGGYLVDIGTSSNATIFDFTPSTLRQTNWFDYNNGTNYNVGYLVENGTAYGDIAYCMTSYNTSRLWSVFNVQLDANDIGSSGIVNIGSLNYSNEMGSSVATNRLQVCVICPIINSDYTWLGSNPPNPPQTGGSAGISGNLTGTTDGTDININVDVDVVYPDYFQHGTYETQTQPIYTDISSAIAEPDLSEIVSGMGNMTDYDASAIWYALGLITASNQWIIWVTISIFGICLLGWILNRFGG